MPSERNHASSWFGGKTTGGGKVIMGGKSWVASLSRKMIWKEVENTAAAEVFSRNKQRFLSDYTRQVRERKGEGTEKAKSVHSRGEKHSHRDFRLWKAWPGASAFQIGAIHCSLWKNWSPWVDRYIFKGDEGCLFLTETCHPPTWQDHRGRDRFS